MAGVLCVLTNRLPPGLARMSVPLSAIPRPGHSHPAFAGLTALVVDGKPPARRFMRELLCGMGIARVFTEGDCGAALARLGADPSVGLALVETSIEGMDGIAFTRQVRQIFPDPRRAMPIVLTMALPTAGLICEARDAGASDILLKPVSLRSLGAKLTAALTAERPFIEARSYVGPDRRRGPRPDYRGPFRRRADPARGTTYI